MRMREAVSIAGLVTTIKWLERELPDVDRDPVARQLRRIRSASGRVREQETATL
jgi:hypothetical protein